MYVLSRNMKKKIEFFLSENFHLLVVKLSVHLDRHVFVMLRTDSRKTTRVSLKLASG